MGDTSRKQRVWLTQEAVLLVIWQEFKFTVPPEMIIPPPCRRKGKILREVPHRGIGRRFQERAGFAHRTSLIVGVLAGYDVHNGA